MSAGAGRALCFALLLGGTGAANGQSMRGTVVSGNRGIGGAVVVLLDSLQRPAGRALTRETGDFIFASAPPGTYRLRILRIGYAPVVAGPYRVPLEVTPLVVRIESNPVQLTAQTVRAGALCSGQENSAAQAFALWEQARTALLATTLTQSESYRVRLSLFERDPGAAERRSVRTGPSTRPYVSLPPDTLAERGYVETDGTTYTYWAPDAEVLLSESFAATHCLSLESSRAGTGARQAGIAFQPIGQRSGIADVRGTLWLDRLSSQLRALDYFYTDAPPAAERIHGGGHVDFAPMADGGWIIPHWEIRVPVPAPRGAASDRVTPGVRRDASAVTPGVRVIGGDIEHIDRGNRVLWQPGRISASVKVQNESGHSVARGTLVWIAQDSIAPGRVPATDDDGIAHLDNVAAGFRRLSILTPQRDSLGLPPFAVSVRLDAEQDAAVPVTIPDSVVAIERLCGAHDAGAPTGIVFGAAPRLGMVSAWWEVAFRRPRGGTVAKRESAHATASEAGRYRLCGMPLDVPIHVGLGPGNTVPLVNETLVQLTAERRTAWWSFAAERSGAP